MKQNAKHYYKLAKHIGVIKVNIHCNVSYVANCFSPSYNGKELQNWVKLGTKIFSQVSSI